jgi:hypothetical protein
VRRHYIRARPNGSASGEPRAAVRGCALREPSHGDTAFGEDMISRRRGSSVRRPTDLPVPARDARVMLRSGSSSGYRNDASAGTMGVDSTEGGMGALCIASHDGSA